MIKKGCRPPDLIPEVRPVKNTNENNQHLDNNSFRKKLLSECMEVVSWYVMMGIGQVERRNSMYCNAVVGRLPLILGSVETRWLTIP
jgi:hypothetical protein